MQIEIVFTQEPQEIKNAISYEQAEDFLKIKTFAKELDRLRESARYLYGKKRGAWGRRTQADDKRSDKISNMNCTYSAMVQAYLKRYNLDELIIDLK
jgi:hypothetical protein